MSASCAMILQHQHIMATAFVLLQLYLFSRMQQNMLKAKRQPFSPDSITPILQAGAQNATSSTDSITPILQGRVHNGTSSTRAANASRKIVLCFPYNGEFRMVQRRLTYSPEALLVVSESPFGHNGLAKHNLSWAAHFPHQRAEYIQQHENLFRSSPHGRWAHEVSLRSVLGRGVRNLYERGEIGDNDIVVVNDADEVMSSEALAWLQAHLQHGETAVADFRWFIFSHCYEHAKMTTLQVAVTVQTLRAQHHWDVHQIRVVHGGEHVVHITGVNLGWHCSWCFGNRAIREKMRLNIEPSSWESRGSSYVFSDAELDRMRAEGMWFDGSTHGTRRCSLHEMVSEIMPYARN